ncbi:hypothetical protein GCM10027169_24210 [Gordonia jinhuaensis]
MPVAQMVVSVGPYALTSATRVAQPAASASVSASPAVTSTRSGLTVSGSSVATTDGVRTAWVTPPAEMIPASAAPAETSRGAIASVAAFGSAIMISKIDASKPGLATASTTLSASSARRCR